MNSLILDSLQRMCIPYLKCLGYKKSSKYLHKHEISGRWGRSLHMKFIYALYIPYTHWLRVILYTILLTYTFNKHCILQLMGPGGLLSFGGAWKTMLCTYILSRDIGWDCSSEVLYQLKSLILGHAGLQTLDKCSSVCTTGTVLCLCSVTGLFHSACHWCFHK